MVALVVFGDVQCRFYGVSSGAVGSATLEAPSLGRMALSSMLWLSPHRVSGSGWAWVGQPAFSRICYCGAGCSGTESWVDGGGKPGGAGYEDGDLL